MNVEEENLAGAKPRAYHESVGAGRERSDRGYDERETTEDRSLSDDERMELFRDSMHQTVLPDLPYMPGYHVCWLTTTNPRDSIQRRLMIGYELIRLDMLPGWDGISLRTGDYAGCVGINEMIAARISISLYNRYIKEVHHKMPLEEEEKLKTRTELLKQNAQRYGGRVSEVDRSASVVQRAAPPIDAQY